MKVVILCGGEGIRLKHQINYIPKALVHIDERPLLWHIMKKYSLSGFNQFILALGKNGDMIRDYFLKYNHYENDINFTIGNPDAIKYYNQTQEEDWNIAFVNTGEEAHTGARLYRCQRFIDSDEFMLAYSDCLSNNSLDLLVKKHKANRKIVTVTGVLPPFRYGEFVVKKNKVVDFKETSRLSAMQGLVNGGYMVCSKKIFNYLTPYNECTLEKEVFKKLIAKNELSIYKHEDFWQCLDNDREFEYLKKLCENNKRYWLEKN